MDVGNLFEDFGLIEAKYDSSKLISGSSLEDKATNDAIELGAEEIEIVDNAEGSVNVRKVFSFMFVMLILFCFCLSSFFAVLSF